jgi:hypothetical protein
MKEYGGEIDVTSEMFIKAVSKILFDVFFFFFLLNMHFLDCAEERRHYFELCICVAGSKARFGL